jgi:hypothetical protein
MTMARTAKGLSEPPRRGRNTRLHHRQALSPNGVAATSAGVRGGSTVPVDAVGGVGTGVLIAAMFAVAHEDRGTRW